jgi:hypothetical protein
MSEWISVKERLPVLGVDERGVRNLPSEEVLIHVPSNEIFVVGYLTIYGWREWVGTACGCCASVDDLDLLITHWMPLPLPPKEPE